MRYLYYDLGEQRQDSWVVAHLHGSAANVILLDPSNFDRYRFDLPFSYTGGLYTHTPARLQIPEDGHWYLVIDCGGYSHHVHTKKIQLLPPDESPTDESPTDESPTDESPTDESPTTAEADRTPVGAGAS